MSVLLVVVVWVVSVGCRPGDSRSAVSNLSVADLTLTTLSVADLTRNSRQVRSYDKQITEGLTQCDVKQTSDSLTFNCPNATAFSSLATQRTGNRSVVVHISRVEEQLDLYPLTNLTLIYLNITNTNITGITQCNLECPKEEEIGARTIWGYMGYFTITVIGIFICCNLLPRCARIQSRSSNRDMTQGRKFDVFVCHAFKDYELVKKMVIAPLYSHGYSVAWHDNAFVPGEWVVESVERTVSSSRRMIVVASENLTDSRWATFEIRRGLHEENAVPGFKITALVTDTLPKLLRRDLYDLVALRTHIVQSNSDYLMKLREFLPDPRPQPINESFSPDALKVYFQLLEQMKEKKKSERVPVTKLFSIRKESSHVSINIDIADTSEMTDKDYETAVQRFKQRLLLDHVKHPHTINSNYMMADHGNDGEVIAQLEGFQLKSSARKSCRF